MLRTELQDEPYSKAEHRRAISPQLDDRSKGSIEFKHQNVSAVRVELGLPYIEGYKPRGNFQALLVNGVKDFLDAHPGFLDRLADSPVVTPDRAPGNPIASTSPHGMPPTGSWGIWGKSGWSKLSVADCFR